MDALKCDLVLGFLFLKTVHSVSGLHDDLSQNLLNSRLLAFVSGDFKRVDKYTTLLIKVVLLSTAGMYLLRDLIKLAHEFLKRNFRHFLDEL